MFEAARVHDGDAIAHDHGLFLVVRDVDKSDAEPALQLMQLDLELAPQFQVQRPERLVQQEHLRFVDNGARQRHALLLPPGKLRRFALRERGDFDQIQAVGDAAFQLGSRDLLHPQAEGHVVPDGHVGEKRVGLEDGVHRAAVGGDVGGVTSMDQQASLIRPI